MSPSCTVCLLFPFAVFLEWYVRAGLESENGQKLDVASQKDGDYPRASQARGKEDRKGREATRRWSCLIERGENRQFNKSSHGEVLEHSSLGNHGMITQRRARGDPRGHIQPRGDQDL